MPAPQHRRAETANPAIQPRPYQTEAVRCAVAALRRQGNTLLQLPTGGGKTYTALLIAAEIGAARVLVLCHREELVRQWCAAAGTVFPGRSVSVVADGSADWSGSVVVAMVPTLCRRLDTGLPGFDLVVADECHHATAPTWLACIRAAQAANPGAMLLGVTATPERGDGKGLRRVFSNVAFVLPVRDLIDAGTLVQPRALAFDVADADALAVAARGAAEFGDQGAVAAILDTPETNAAMLRHWHDQAAGRRTIAFTGTVAHAHSLAAAFRSGGVPAEAVDGTMPGRDRRAILGRLAGGETPVVSNCMVLTEGFDEPLVSAVLLARCARHKSTLIQMAGRGLRSVDAAKYPGVIKTDCIILDVARNFARHGDITAGTRLDDRPAGDAPTKTCPECEAEVPAAVATCPLCGYAFPARERATAKPAALNGRLIEVDILTRSPFAWVEVADGLLIACGFDASAAVRRAPRRKDLWVAVGLPSQGRAIPLRVGMRHQAIAAADDYLRTHETGQSAHKTRAWLTAPATLKQVEALLRYGAGAKGLTRYAATAELTAAVRSKAITAAAFEAMRGAG